MVLMEPEVELDAETSAAVDVGIRAANEGRVTPSDEVPRLIREWISKLSTPSPR